MELSIVLLLVSFLNFFVSSRYESTRVSSHSQGALFSDRLGGREVWGEEEWISLSNLVLC